MAGPVVDQGVEVERGAVEDDASYPVGQRRVVEEANDDCPAHAVSNENQIFRPRRERERRRRVQILPLVRPKLIVPAGTGWKPSIVAIGNRQSGIPLFDQRWKNAEELSAVRSLPVHEDHPHIRSSGRKPSGKVAQGRRNLDLLECDAVRGLGISGVGGAFDADGIPHSRQRTEGDEVTHDHIVSQFDDLAHLVVGIGGCQSPRAGLVPSSGR